MERMPVLEGHHAGWDPRDFGLPLKKDSLLLPLKVTETLVSRKSAITRWELTEQPYYRIQYI